ncbi:hypothetical protein N9L49_02265 [Rhodospirillales bacterium]|nr:hypothetical protein [Rhodospirillales bacterium]
MINLIKRQIRRLRGDHVVSAEMARLQDELAKQSDMIRQLVAGSFSNSFSNLGDAKNPGKQIVNLDSDSLISKLQPFMIKLLEEYARSEQYGHEKWNPEEMSVKSYLGQRGRSACEALEDLRWGDKLNIGPGATWSRPGWKTLDCYRSAGIEMDLRKCKPFPVPDNSFQLYILRTVSNTLTMHLA